MVYKIGFFNTEIPSIAPFLKTTTNCSGGAGLSLVEMITQLDERKYERIIISTGNERFVQKENPEKNLILYRYPTLGAILNNHKSPFKLFPSSNFILQPLKFSFDLVHCQLGLVGPELPILIHRIKNNTPFVLSIRGPFNTNWGSLKRKLSMNIYLNSIYPLILEKSDAIVIPTKGFLEQSSKLKSYKEKIHVVPNGVDFKNFSKYNNRTNLDSSILNHEKNDFDNLLLFVGLLIERKGIKTLLDSFNRVLDERPDTGLVIVGKGSLSDYIKEKAKKEGYRDNLIMPGYISNPEDLAKIYSLSDLFVFPSMAETFGRVVLESMASGTPTLVSDIGPLMDVIDYGSVGMYAEVGNPNDFARKILEFFEMDKTKKEYLKDKGIEYAREHSWEDVAKQMENIYEDLLS